MRIISKFKDYYDTVQIYGVDNKTTFIRKTSDPISSKTLDILASDFDWPGKSTFRKIPWNATNVTLIPHDYLLLFFCGAVYPIVVYQEILNNTNIKLTYCYDINAIDTLMIKHKVEKYFEKEKYISWFIDLRRKNKIKELFNIPINKNKVVTLHHKIESPYFIFSLYDSTIIINPILKNLQFFRIIDAFKAYQEIYMFISGILGGKSPKIIEVSDEIRKYKHGFDKWSFKTTPKDKKKEN